MKKFIFIVCAFVLYQEWGSVRNYFDPAPNYAEAHGVQVVLYATDWCPYCKQARALLKEHDIQYVEYDIEKSEEGNAQYKRLGGRGVPVLQVNGEVVKGFKPERILKLAKQKAA